MRRDLAPQSCRMRAVPAAGHLGGRGRQFNDRACPSRRAGNQAGGQTLVERHRARDVSRVLERVDDRSTVEVTPLEFGGAWSYDGAWPSTEHRGRSQRDKDASTCAAGVANTVWFNGARGCFRRVMSHGDERQGPSRITHSDQ